MTTNRVPSYKDPIHWGNYRSKGKSVVQDDRTVDVGESVNDEAKLMVMVDDGNIVPHGEPMEHFQSYTKFDGDDHEDGEEEIDPLLQPRKAQHEKFPYYFSGNEDTQPTHWGIHDPLPLPALAQKYRKGATKHSYNSNLKLFQLFKNKEELNLNLGLKSVSEHFQYKVKKLTKDRFKAVCYMDNCNWWIRATKHNTIDSFQVKHTCSNIQLRPHHLQANKKVLGHFLNGILADSNGNMLWGKQIQQTLNDCLCVHISYWQAWNAKMYALNLLRGTHG
uniref:Transposase MuDR plant domain-containing protein n=1 Tax=Lactuca sativa TaxID=4236 RepID=A0A9R1W0Z5_LACSA|nr:hypothetical protein LSAT_V11C300105250 [Lactuca sativa]